MSPTPTGAIVSFPKSGRTWYRLMVSQYLSASAGGPAVDMSTMFEWLPNADQTQNKGYKTVWADGAPTPQRIVASHSGTWLSRVPRAVLLLRDPAEALVSLFHHERKHMRARRFDGDFDDFLGWEGGLGRLVRFLADVDTHRHEADVAVLTYDGVQRDPAGALRTGLSHLGVDEVDPARVEAAVEHGRFDRMAAMEASTGLPIGDYDLSDRDARRVRAGVADRGTTLFDEDRRARVVAAIESEVSSDGLAWLRAQGPADWTW